MTRYGDLNCCEECFVLSHDVPTEFGEKAVPEGCGDEECDCHTTKDISPLMQRMCLMDETYDAERLGIKLAYMNWQDEGFSEKINTFFEQMKAVRLKIDEYADRIARGAV